MIWENYMKHAVKLLSNRQREVFETEQTCGICLLIKRLRSNSEHLLYLQYRTTFSASLKIIRTYFKKEGLCILAK